MFNLSQHGPVPLCFAGALQLGFLPLALDFGADIMAFIFSRRAKIAVLRDFPRKVATDC